MKVLWTLPAVNDLESIQNFIAKDSELYATSFIEKILYSVEKLDKFPFKQLQNLQKIIEEANYLKEGL